MPKSLFPLTRLPSPINPLPFSRSPPIVLLDPLNFNSVAKKIQNLQTHDGVIIRPNRQTCCSRWRIASIQNYTGIAGIDGDPILTDCRQLAFNSNRCRIFWWKNLGIERDDVSFVDSFKTFSKSSGTAVCNTIYNDRFP